MNPTLRGKTSTLSHYSMTSAEMHKAVSTAKIEASIQEERNISAMVKIPLDFDNLDLTQRKDCSIITIFMCYVGKRFFKR